MIALAFAFLVVSITMWLNAIMFRLFFGKRTRR